MRVTYDKEENMLNCDCCKQKIYIAVTGSLPDGIYASIYLYSSQPQREIEDRDEDDMLTDEDNDEQSQYELVQQSYLSSNK